MTLDPGSAMYGNPDASERWSVPAEGGDAQQAGAEVYSQAELDAWEEAQQWGANERSCLHRGFNAGYVEGIASREADMMALQASQAAAVAQARTEERAAIAELLDEVERQTTEPPEGWDSLLIIAFASRLALIKLAADRLAERGESNG